MTNSKIKRLNVQIMLMKGGDCSGSSLNRGGHVSWGACLGGGRHLSRGRGRMSYLPAVLLGTACLPASECRLLSAINRITRSRIMTLRCRPILEFTDLKFICYKVYYNNVYCLFTTNNSGNNNKYMKRKENRTSKLYTYSLIID